MVLWWGWSTLKLTLIEIKYLQYPLDPIVCLQALERLAPRVSPNTSCKVIINKTDLATGLQTEVYRSVILSWKAAYGRYTLLVAILAIATPETL